MKRPVLLLAALLTLATLAGPAQAQNVYFNLGSDSVLALRPGSTHAVELGFYSNGNGISAYSVTLRFDPSVIHVGTVTTGFPGSLPDPTITLGTGQVTIAASGSVPTYYYQVPVANVTLSIDAAATSGALVQVDVNQLVGYFGTDLLPTTTADVLNVCTSSKTWGDIDANGAVNTRDALIALSAAVGLSTGGFDLSSGDVDNDGTVTSRDALFMLSVSLGLPAAGRTGNGVADKCAPLVVSPADLVVTTPTGTDRVNAGDTLRTSLTLAVPRNLSTPIRWSPVSPLLAYECSGTAPYYQDICVVDANGVASPGALHAGNGVRAADPAWSPDGNQIAYVLDYNGSGHIYIMDANGGNNHLVLYGYGASGLSWSPDGTRLVFTACCTSLYSVNVDGSNPAELFPSSYLANPADPVWSPTGDSVAYTAYTRNYIFKAGAAGGSDGVPAVRLIYQPQYASWVTAGLVFQRPSPNGGADIWIQQASDGLYYRLTHGPMPGGETRADMRRSPGVWISSIVVTPTTPTVSVSGASSGKTVPMIATVTNSNLTTNATAPVTWSSANSSIASVDATGLVTAISPGLVYVRATVGGWRTDSTQVAVQP